MELIQAGETNYRRGLGNAIKWAKGLKWSPWKLITIVREIRALFLGHKISFALVRGTANGVVDFFVKNGVDSLIAGVFYLLNCSRFYLRGIDKMQGAAVFYFISCFVFWMLYWMYFSFC